MTKHIILFLAANPLGTDRLALDEEARAIQQELERSGHRDQFELVTRWAVQPLDLLRELRKLKPTIVHFSGHGGGGAGTPAGEPRRDVATGLGADDVPDGLFFQGADGRPQIVTTVALAETFGAAGSSVKVVVLSACYSEMQSAALVAHVDAVVGMPGAIGDAAARSFAIGFYGGLAERESVDAAYRDGCAAIGLDGVSDRGRPQLKTRRALAPGTATLVGQPVAIGWPASGRRRRVSMERAAIANVIVLSNLSVSGAFLTFCALAPALGFPGFDGGDALRLLEITLPVLLGYLGAAVQLLFGGDRRTVRMFDPVLFVLFVRGPAVIFALTIAAALTAYGFSHRVASPIGSGLDIEVLAGIVAASMGLLVASTSVIMGYLFGVRGSKRRG